MESVAKALLTAKEEVFITDWWLSPEIMMIRPTDDETFRLDNLLGKIAVRSSNDRGLKFICSLGQWRSCLRSCFQRSLLCYGLEQSSYETCTDWQE